MKGKLIVIEGTENSGKQTQAKILKNKLDSLGYPSQILRFPMYDTPTGKIIKEEILNKNGKSIFNSNIPPRVSALYYAADRVFNIEKINDLLNKGVNVILDRYVESNMAYQAAKCESTKDKIDMILWLEQLEFNMLNLPRPDRVIFLYLPHQYRYLLNKDTNFQDQNIEEVYHLLAERYNFSVVNCIFNDKLKSVDEISDEILEVVKKHINQM